MSAPAKSDEFYPLHLYRVKSTEMNPERIEFLAPSPLVAAFLHSPYGYTHKTLSVEMVEEKPEIGEFDHDQLEIFIREHFVFGSDFYGKKPIEQVFAHIENCMDESMENPVPHAFKMPDPARPQKAKASLTGPEM